jgi:hypothetical protein
MESANRMRGEPISNQFRQFHRFQPRAPYPWPLDLTHLAEWPDTV